MLAQEMVIMKPTPELTLCQVLYILSRKYRAFPHTYTDSTDTSASPRVNIMLPSGAGFDKYILMCVYHYSIF